MEASGWETASSDGTFALEGVPEGPVALLARNPAFTSARIEGIAVRAGQTTQVLIELGEGRGVQGSVRIERQPVSGAKVSARKLDGGLTREAVTSPDGLYEIGNLPAGDYEVSSEAKASDGSVVRIKESVTVHQERFTRVDLELGAVVLSGRVLRRELPVKEAQIAVHLDGEAVAEGQTDAAGKYSFGLRGQRTYLFTVQGNGIEELELELTLPEAPAEVTQDFDLR